MALTDDDLQLDAEELQLEDLPDGALPVGPPTDGAPAPKKLCTEKGGSATVPGSSSSAAHAMNTPALMPNAYALPSAPLATAPARLAVVDVLFTDIPLPPQDDPCFLRIPAVINFEDDSSPALLNISSHVCSFCGNNHRDANNEIFPTKRGQRLTNKQQLSFAQLQQANSVARNTFNPPSPPLLFLPSFLRTPHLSLMPANLLAYGLPASRLMDRACSPPLSPNPPLPSLLSSPETLTHLPLGSTLGSKHPLHICKVLLPPTLALPSLPLLPRQLLGSRATPAAFRNDPGLLYIGLDVDVEPWTCALCNLTCGAALDSAMAHIASELQAAKKLSAHLPAAKEKYIGWKVMAFVALP
ncbi:unnamed protein product [Closterium sp. Naga37s-1]|nr:unnamed protein product [Closterium sp. Naga37s-1]